MRLIANQRKRETDKPVGHQRPKLLENRSSFATEALALFMIINIFLNFNFPPHLQAVTYGIPARHLAL